MKRTMVLIVAGFSAALAGCGPERRRADEPEPKQEATAQTGYLAPPEVSTAQAVGAEVILVGRAAPKARVRLATPQGEARTVAADEQGVWRLALPAAAGPRIFGLSMTAAGRVVQSEGYLLVMPDGRAAQLRAGAGARAFRAGGPTRIAAIDFDADGGAVVSGVTTAAAAVSVRVDNRQLAEGRADEAGRFSIAIGQPLASGRHAVEVASEGGEHSAVVDVTPAAALTAGPFRTAPAAQGLRVDWLTPGGGVQSTVILG